jgi:hypothetical protein
VGIDHLKATLQDKQDELAGNNGYERISDEQLNGFSDYAVQNMEQADMVITISNEYSRHSICKIYIAD